MRQFAGRFPMRRRTMLGLASASAIGLGVLAGCDGSSNSSSSSSGLPGSRASQDQVTRGRYLVLAAGCTDCHNRGKGDPSDPQWLAGYTTGSQDASFTIGPFKTYAANLTPDAATGLGKFTDRQIYNALKYGLTPDTAPDAIISATTPGQGNFPATPHYLAPPMPWPAIRHYADADLWSIIAYVKHGIKAVANAVPSSQGPPDFWAGSYNANAIGPADPPAYPTGSEQFNP